MTLRKLKDLLDFVGGKDQGKTKETLFVSLLDRVLRLYKGPSCNWIIVPSRTVL